MHLTKSIVWLPIVTCVVCSVLVVVGCGDDARDPNTKTDAGGGDVPPAGEGCPRATPVFAYGDNGLEAEDEKLDILGRILEASDAPPRKFENTWTISLTQGDGTVVDDMQVFWACSYMPEHTHGAFPAAVVKNTGGKFDLNEINLFMEGGWEMWLWVDPKGEHQDFDPERGFEDQPCLEPDGAKPNIVFPVCVPKE